MYDVYSKFNLQKHIEKYKNYLEVIIFPTGHIEYAVPSHQEKLISIAMEKFFVSRDTLNSMCPQSYYFDFMNWLCKMTGCVAVYNIGYIGEILTNQQQEAIDKFKEAGLFKEEMNG